MHLSRIQNACSTQRINILMKIVSTFPPSPQYLSLVLAASKELAFYCILQYFWTDTALVWVVVESCMFQAVQAQVFRHCGEAGGKKGTYKCFHCYTRLSGTSLCKLLGFLCSTVSRLKIRKTKP